jgi:hypothetical protein
MFVALATISRTSETAINPAVDPAELAGALDAVATFDVRTVVTGATVDVARAVVDVVVAAGTLRRVDTTSLATSRGRPATAAPRASATTAIVTSRADLRTSLGSDGPLADGRRPTNLSVGRRSSPGRRHISNGG